MKMNSGAIRKQANLLSLYIYSIGGEGGGGKRTKNVRKNLKSLEKKNK
jgi:hypothetical protein